MSEKRFRRRAIPISGRRSRPPHHPSPASSPHRRTNLPTTRRSLSKASKNVRVLSRCSSEPSIRITGNSVSGGQDQCSPESEVLYRRQTCEDIFFGLSYLGESPKRHEFYKEAKVVVNVTVEGSAGPVRAMVKLGSSVEDTIRIVVNKYREEGRCPKLDRNTTKLFQLHSSYFSLHGLNRSDTIDNVGGRSFYLRKISPGEEMEAAPESPVTMKVISSSPVAQPLFFLVTAFIEHAIGKLTRRTRKLWKVLGCMQCG